MSKCHVYPLDVRQLCSPYCLVTMLLLMGIKKGHKECHWHLGSATEIQPLQVALVRWLQIWEASWGCLAILPGSTQHQTSRSCPSGVSCFCCLASSVKASISICHTDLMNHSNIQRRQEVAQKWPCRDVDCQGQGFCGFAISPVGFSRCRR